MAATVPAAVLVADLACLTTQNLCAGRCRSSKELTCSPGGVELYTASGTSSSVSWWRCASVAGIFGISLGKHVTQSGFFDDGSQSVKARCWATTPTAATGQPHRRDCSPRPGQDRRRPGVVRSRSRTSSTSSRSDHPDQVLGWAGYLVAPPPTRSSRGWQTRTRSTPSSSIPLKGDNDDSILNNYKAVAPDLQKLDGGKVKLAGLRADGQRLTGTIADRPATRRGVGHPAGGGGAVLRVRRRDRGCPAGDRRRPDHRGRAGHRAAARRVQSR